MTEIYCVAHPEHLEDARRHLAALVRALEAGADLGPRGFHIRSLGSSLDRTLAELRRQQEVLLASPEATTPEAQKLLRYVPELTATLEPLIELVRTFPS